VTTTKTDPPVKKNGKCVVCNSQRPPIAQACGDPFCSAKCCREWYEVNT
jgi:hypothetical protein